MGVGLSTLWCLALAAGALVRSRHVPVESSVRSGGRGPSLNGAAAGDAQPRDLDVGRYAGGVRDTDASADDSSAVSIGDSTPHSTSSPDAPVAGLLCFRCGYDLRATNSDDLCPECGLSVATSVSSSMLAAEGVTHGPALRTGLVLLAASLFMIPVIPWVAFGVGMGTSLRGFIAVIAVLMTIEHGLWLVGVWRSCGYAAAQPVEHGGRRSAAVARSGAVVCAMAAMVAGILLVRAGNLHGGRELDTAMSYLTVCTTVMLIARMVSLLAGSRAAGVGLRALRCGGTATALRLTAILGTVVSVVVALGTVGARLMILDRGDWQDFGVFAGYLLIFAVPGVWLCGLAGGVVCTVAATKVDRRLKRLRAS